MNLNNLDFNLLKVLDALIAERNVTRAAERVGRSQPAVSNALHKLRKLLGDDLLVRGRRGFLLTPRAEAIRLPLREAIALTEACLTREPQFDPATASDVFRLSTPDRLSLAVVPPLFERLRKLAPKMSLQVITADREPALALLEADRTDVALSSIDDKPDHLNAEYLLEENMFCVMRRGHPLLRRGAKFDMASVLGYPHVVVSASGNRTAIFDDMLHRHHFQRHALVVVSNFTAVPHILARSDMIGVFTDLASKVLKKSFDLATRPVPTDVGKIATSMIWHSRNENDKKHVWLRQQIKAVYDEF